ncbi:Dbl homology domain-containing protein, partial [Baffinella frigidus]
SPRVPFQEGSTCSEVTSSYCAPEHARRLISSLPLQRSPHADVWAFGKILYEMACGSPSALVKETGDDSDSDALRAVAALEGDVVHEELLRFPVVRSVVRDALATDAPRTAIALLMQRGFWSGNATATVEIPALTPASQRSHSSDVSGVVSWVANAPPGRPGTERRRPVVRELIQTEEAYCKSLRLMSEQSGRVDLQEVSPMFVELEDIQNLNDFFLRQLETRVRVEGEKCLGEILKQFAETLMRNYARYVAHYEESNEQLQEMKRGDPALQELFYRGVGPARHSVPSSPDP